jgi:hypothetical protein
MKAATATEIKRELKVLEPEELQNLCLRLSRFKKENKELLTYLLFEAADEESFIQSVKDEVEELFAEINTTSYYFIKKSVRKILRVIKKYARYSPHKTTEIELLIHFCHELKSMRPSMKNNQQLMNIYYRQIQQIRKQLKTLDEDLQYDYGLELEKLV